jgi:hypothetical protein
MGDNSECCPSAAPLEQVPEHDGERDGGDGVVADHSSRGVVVVESVLVWQAVCGLALARLNHVKM